jgi:hypothetical protein
MIERKIIIGLITSTDYLRQIRGEWNDVYIESPMARRLSAWCWEYFEKYDRAPSRDIEGIYLTKIKAGNIPTEVAEEIERDILPSLSTEYSQEGTNLAYLLDVTLKYFKERKLQIHAESIQALLAGHDIEEAERVASEFKPTSNGSRTDLDLSSDSALDRVDRAFNSSNQGLITYPGAMGEFWNDQLVRGAFIALMASEKRGKTFWLLDMSLRAYRQNRRVAFFQAGDMTETQQIKRMCVYLTRKSDSPKYSGKMWEPVPDCIFNQTNNCKRSERECKCGVFEGEEEKKIMSETFLDDLISAYHEHKNYVPCTFCEEFKMNRWGVPWIVEVDTGSPLTAKEARQAIRKFFIENGKSFKLSSHSNGTLSIRQMKAQIAIWNKQDNFVPDVIVVDYADLLVPETKVEFRHQQNEIWKGLRNLSQEFDCLVVTATQADAASYEQNRLKLKNFSEDKRKYAHVTAMYGLNQDVSDREKKIGIMRVNELVKREGEFSSTNEIKVLQNLKRGRPFLQSYM